MPTNLRIAMLSVHTCPLATLGGKETGGMNVYVRDLSRELGRRGHHIDVYTRSQDPNIPRISQEIGTRARVIHLPAGPERPYDKHRVYDHLPEFVEGALTQARADEVQYDVLHSVVCVPRRFLGSTASTPHLPTRGNLGFLVATRSNVSDVLPAPRTAWRLQSPVVANVRSRHTPALRFLAENGQGFF